MLERVLSCSLSDWDSDILSLPSQLFPSSTGAVASGLQGCLSCLGHPAPAASYQAVNLGVEVSSSLALNLWAF